MASRGASVAAVVGRKGTAVTTVSPTATLAEAASLLADHGIGALVVSADGSHVDGLLSERDIVRCLARDGADSIEVVVADAMTRDVATCTLGTTTDELAALMTEGRFRHVPVVENGTLMAIVSIGDVVKSRLDELTQETDQLQAYVAGSY